MRIDTVDDLAATVRERRKQMRLTQEEVARRVGVSRRWVYQLEQGKASAELGLVLRLLQALGLQVEIRPEGARSERPGEQVDLDAHLNRYRPT